MLSKLSEAVVQVGNPKFNRMQDQSGSSQISIAGGPVRGNNYTLDGISITDSTNRAVIIPSLEAVQEMKVQANTYDAEMGRTGGGTFNTFLRSGTNEVHGSRVRLHSRDRWLANNFFSNRAGQPRIEQPFRNYGGSIGGPICIPKLYNGRNKTFFWVTGEAYRQTEAAGYPPPVPTAPNASATSRRRSHRENGALQIIYDPLSTDGRRQRAALRRQHHSARPHQQHRRRWPPTIRCRTRRPALLWRSELRCHRRRLQPRRPDDLGSSIMTSPSGGALRLRICTTAAANPAMPGSATSRRPIRAFCSARSTPRR